MIIMNLFLVKTNLIIVLFKNIRRVQNGEHMYTCGGKKNLKSKKKQTKKKEKKIKDEKAV